MEVRVEEEMSVQTLILVVCERVHDESEGGRASDWKQEKCDCECE